MLEHISLEGTLSWIKLLVKYTIAIQMLNKCIIKTSRPMGGWRQVALHWEWSHLDTGTGLASAPSLTAARPLSAPSSLASSQMWLAMIVIWSQLWFVMMWERQRGAAADNNFCNCYDHYYWTSSMRVTQVTWILVHLNSKIKAQNKPCAKRSSNLIDLLVSCLSVDVSQVFQSPDSPAPQPRPLPI